MKRGVQLILLAFAISVLLLFAYYVRGALLLIYVSAVFAVILTPAVNAVHRLSLFGWRPSRGAAILLILAAGIGAFVLLLVFAVPPIIADLTDLGKQLPQKITALHQRMNSIPVLRSIKPGDVERYFGSIAGTVGNLVTNVTQAVVAAAAVATLTAYLILDGKRAFNWALSLFPESEAERLRPTLQWAAERMWRWLVGQAILMLILGSASAAAYGLMGIRYFYLLAVFGGVANIIPFFGPILTVILAALVAATDSLWKVVGVTAFYLAYEQVETAYLTPRIMKAQVQLSSSAVLIALLLGGELAGIVGALVAIPSAVLFSALIEEYLVHRR